MRKKIVIILMCSFGCFHASAQDEVLYQRDSVVEKGNDCTEGLFSRSEKISSPAKITVVTRNQKTVKLPAYLLSLQGAGGDNVVVAAGFQQYGLVDLDQDGKKELVIWNNTGGAHCCDEIYIFRTIARDKYQYAAKTFAGDVCVSPNNEFTYSFYQQLGYFFTCFACAYTDTSDSAPIEMRSIMLVYKKGKLVPVPGDQELRSIINDNLGKLGEQPFEKLADATSQDNGLRKEFAMNLAVFYYSFGKNMAGTKKMFTKYYKFPDAAKVWAEFVKQLQSISKNSDI